MKGDALREGRQKGRQGTDPQTEFQGALLLKHADASAIAKYPFPSWDLSSHLPWKEWESADPDTLLEV